MTTVSKSEQHLLQKGLTVEGWSQRALFIYIGTELAKWERMQKVNMATTE